MKVIYTTKDGRMTFELEAETQIDLFKQLASIQEVFEISTCTKDGSETDDIRYVVRENADGDEFFELQYSGSDPKFFGLRKTFGQYKKGGGLFPRRKWGAGHPNEGEWMPDNGWVRWDREKGHEV